jgi:hypothetical protein
MASWNVIFGDLEPEPVRGQPASYEAASSESRRLHTLTDAIEQEFARTTSTGSLAELRGDTADRLVQLINEMGGSLAGLPAVFGDLDVIFTQHAESLGALRQRAADGLARAHTRWSAVHSARDEHVAAVGLLNFIETQLQHLRGSGDDWQLIDQADRVDRLDALERELWRQRDVVANRQSQATEASAELELSRGEYHGLVADELELVATTIASIGRIPLDDLRDPSALAQFASDVVTVLVACGREAAEALIDDVLDLVLALTAIADFTITESLRVVAIAIKGMLLVHVVMAVAILQLLSKRFPPPYTSGDLASGGRPRISTDPKRANFATSGNDDAEIGLNTMLITLGHTADESQIFKDEFEVIRITDNRFIVVLPGVTDLSRPNYGLDPHTRTVRDLDQSALASNASIGMDGNRYAQMVMETMLAAGVPLGAEVMLVGHSFGSDTALDLAADVRFNGPSGFDVTHALAAAYDSGAQLPFVPASTEVLVLQNQRDVVVLAEHAGTPVTSGIGGFFGGLDRIIDRDPLGGLGDIATAGATLARAHLPADQLALRVDVLRPGHTQIVFADEVGTASDLGHRQSTYLHYLRNTTEPAVRDFAASVGAAGYGDPGQVAALDVSVPSP